LSFYIELDKEKTIIRKYTYNSYGGGVAIGTTPTIAYRIILNYFKEYGDQTFTDYLVTDPNLDFIEIFTQSYDEDSNEFTYFSSQIIKKGDPVIFKNYNKEHYGILRDFNKDVVYIKSNNNDKNNYYDIEIISLYRFAVLNSNYNKVKILDKWGASL